MTPEFFRKSLLDWAVKHPRPLPWKGIRDPYRIWLSEIILQQTRVEQGLPYYEKFVQNYPDVKVLAAAPDDEVFKCWEGLGYYSRCRNLLHSARYIAHELNGVFPTDFEGLCRLKGVGKYTAAAIASFAYDLPHAVLDGNVYRVLARCRGIDIPINSPAAQKHFAGLAEELLDRAQPAAYNQAMMDFGATWCTPKQPKCMECPFKHDCIAFREEAPNKYPVKTAAPPKKERYFLYFVLKIDDSLLLHKRLGKDIWHNLWEFPLLETDKKTWHGLNSDAAQRLLQEKYFPEANFLPPVHARLSSPFRQILTHQVVSVLFLAQDMLPAHAENSQILKAYQAISPWEIRQKIAFPKVIERYLREHFNSQTEIG